MRKADLSSLDDERAATDAPGAEALGEQAPETAGAGAPGAIADDDAEIVCGCAALARHERRLPIDVRLDARLRRLSRLFR